MSTAVISSPVTVGIKPRTLPFNSVEDSSSSRKRTTSHGAPSASSASDSSFDWDAATLAEAQREWDEARFDFVGKRPQQSPHLSSSQNINNSTNNTTCSDDVSVRFDLAAQKDAFAKLKYRFLELHTKKAFLKTVQMPREHWGISEESAAADADLLKKYKREHAAAVSQNERLEAELAQVAAEMAALYTKIVEDRESVREQALAVLPADGEEAARMAAAAKKRAAGDKSRGEAVVASRKQKYLWYKELVSTIEHLSGAQITEATENSATISRARYDVSIAFTSVPGSVRPASFGVEGSEDIPFDDIAAHAIQTGSVAFFMREFSCRELGWSAHTQQLFQVKSEWPQAESVQQGGATTLTIPAVDSVHDIKVTVPFDFPSRTGARPIVLSAAGHDGTPAPKAAQAVETANASISAMASTSLMDLINMLVRQFQ